MSSTIATVAMIISIGFVTYTIYVVTSAQHLLSLPGMAILACAIVLMTRDELAVSIDDFIWSRIQASTLRKCISGSYQAESGWLVLALPKQPRSPIRRFLRSVGGQKRQVRVLRIVADDGEEVYIGWDFRTMHSHTDGQIKLPDGKCYEYVKQLFS